MVVLPEETPVTTPVPDPTVATEEVELVQVPPAEGSVSVTVPSVAQILVVPTIAPGKGRTFSVKVT